VAGGDRAEAVRGEEDSVPDWRGRLVSDARARESEGECGWRVGSGSSERERESSRGGLARARKQAGGGPRGGEVASAGRERPRVWAGNRSNQGGRFLLFLISYFHFLFLFLLSPFLLNN
jgi:hypothetical protein